MSCDFQDGEMIQVSLNSCGQIAGVAVGHNAGSAAHCLPGRAPGLGEDRRENARCGAHIGWNQETHRRVGEEHRLPWQHEPAERVGGMTVDCAVSQCILGIVFRDAFLVKCVDADRLFRLS